MLRKPRRHSRRRVSEDDSCHNYRSYADIKLTDEDIRRGAYRQYLGGGEEDEKWDRRGTFQLDFLRAMGMSPSDRLLDVGCGPARAGRFLIDFLDSGNYCGVDYNPDFIRAAREVSRENNLDIKAPAFEVVKHFDFQHMQPVFDYALVFSVLNHCKVPQRGEFFNNIDGPLKTGGRIYISHAHWFDESYLPQDTALDLTGSYAAGDFDIEGSGWNGDSRVFPILELTKTG